MTDSKGTEVRLPTGSLQKASGTRCIPHALEPTILHLSSVLPPMPEAPLWSNLSPMRPPLRATLCCPTFMPSLTILCYRISPHCQSLLRHIYNCVPQNFSDSKIKVSHPSLFYSFISLHSTLTIPAFHLTRSPI